MYNPISTYRIQLNKEFNFEDIKRQLDYYSLLGIATLYASPVFEATPGSKHGYDGTYPLDFNPEIGTKEQFDEIAELLKKKHMGWVQDIVPNHMAYNYHNCWLRNLLRNGRDSKYAGFFDLDFNHPQIKNKLIAPFLESSLDEVIKKRDIELSWHEGSFIFKYFNNMFPVTWESMLLIFESSAQKKPPELLKLLEVTENTSTDTKNLHANRRKIKDSMQSLYSTNNHFKEFVNSILQSVNSNEGEFRRFLNMQYYELCFWRDTEKVINYRRFFTVNELICLNMDRDDVFNEFHPFIEDLIRKEKIQGLRVDHIDGLYHPYAYLTKLRTLAGGNTFIVIEKILGKNEKLPKNWPIQGNTGYDFMTILNSLFTYEKNYKALLKFYQQITKAKDSPEEVIYSKKKMILTGYMQGELDNLTRLFEELKLADFSAKGISVEKMKIVIGEFLVECPVYKIYSSSLPLSDEDQKTITAMLKRIASKNKDLRNEIAVLRSVFFGNELTDAEKKKNALYFLMRCMQFTGAIMAKGVEDTAMYCYNGFLAHNEVGDSPWAKGMDVEQFHRQMSDRRAEIPSSINATSTHDTKRSEDVRSRLFLISEFADEWILLVKKWVNINKSLKASLNNSEVPSLNHEYFIYQTLLGFYPMEGTMTEILQKRLEDYLIKAFRESKENTTWTAPNETYEKSALDFTRKILEPTGEFLKDFGPFHHRISEYGIVNSLSMLVLKCTCPGIPDIYQGTEFWDFSLVDPDNRRAVDYQSRHTALNEIMRHYDLNPDGCLSELYRTRSNGRIKIWLMQLLLLERKRNPETFSKGDYIPLKTKGTYKDHILAFARNYKKSWYIIAIPVHSALITEKVKNKQGTFDWKDTRILIPPNAMGKYLNILKNLEWIVKNELFISSFFRDVQLIVLRSRNEGGFPISSIYQVNSE